MFYFAFQDNGSFLASLGNGSKISQDAVEQEQSEVNYTFYAFNASLGPDEMDPSWVVFWANDYHIAVIRDLKHLLAPLKTIFIDKSLSAHCHITKTCTSDLKVLNKGNAMFVSDVASLSRQFFDAYKNDALMRRVDVFVCFHPVAMCQMFMPFNKTIIVIAASRYEQGRESPEQWRQLNEDMIKWSKKRNNIIAGNNLYDTEYIKYFTGIDAILLPSFCGYADAEYKGSKKEILLSPMYVRGQSGNAWSGVTEGLSRSAQKLNSSLVFKSIRDIYPYYEFTDLVEHPAIVYIPYQVSVMSLFEQYRMGIPLFFPSIDFLIELHLSHVVIGDRTWARIRGNSQPRQSAIPKSPLYNGTAAGYDPNNDVDRKTIKAWLVFADFYQWPHIQYFDSWDECIQKIQNADLHEISRGMKKYSKKLYRELMAKWTVILKNIVNDRSTNMSQSLPSDYDTAMRTIYG